MLREIISGVAILVIALFIFSYIFDPMTRYQTNTFFSGISEQISSGIKGISSSAGGGGNKCRELAETLIPKNLTLKLGVTLGGGTAWESQCTMCFFTVPDIRDYGNPFWGNGLNFWNDSSEITDYALWVQGKSEGQNINYYYITHNYGTMYSQASDDLTYSKQIISKDGTILGTRTFTIIPILTPISGSEMTDKPLVLGDANPPHHFMKFEIVEPNFTSCHWITDNGTVIE